MASLVYIACALTSTSCALLLTRGYLKNKTKLLLWSSLCFAGLALNNILLFFDLTIIENLDLSVIRGLPALFGVTLLIYGLIWETT